MESSFLILKNIGSLTLEDNSEIRFSIDSYRGYKYASIRKYLKSDTYTGPTKSGITMTADIVKGIAAVIKELPDTTEEIQESELGKFAKRPGLSVIVRTSSFRGKKGLDIRQWQEDQAYKGWTKKGIRLPLDKVKEVKELFAQIDEALKE
ncbi:MAG: hypothetical protein HN833_01310 [Elusimicrobiaceae bacterium]|nr:hypothetical protein [Elusimicrobiaceae bacterium]MBT4008717.1 hypothetical protein [Elusimicrobiaceae bacterium]MBT4402357.1 hypothetical protein [Elusimicrobiaceae bacterium]MBT4440461.1 hypothetical protein [Elusimicrobiaceae bacterium]MBT5987766.1 hypothetical protein [Elusimicrobiaceae bacterium]